jgi:hypothetical protein
VLVLLLTFARIVRTVVLLIWGFIALESVAGVITRIGCALSIAATRAGPGALSPVVSLKEDGSSNGVGRC